MLMEAGYQKVSKMIKNKTYFLSGPKKKLKGTLNRDLFKGVTKKIIKILKQFDAYLIHDCDFFFNFNGRDIDALYRKRDNSLKIRNGIILRNLGNNSLRIHINQPNSKNFLSLDIEETSSLHPRIEKIFKKNFNIKIYCKKTDVKHLDQKSIIFFKLVKYFNSGMIHSFDQLLILKKDLKKLKKDEFNLVTNSVQEALPAESPIIKNFFRWKFRKFYNSKNVKNFFFDLRVKRHKQRKIFFGKLNLKKVIFSRKFIYALFFGSNAKWSRFHKPMPAISIVGNDGSGKTTLTNFIRSFYSKMDPLILDMKASSPFLLNETIRNNLMKIKKYKLVKKIFFLDLIISTIGELLDFFDKYVRYKIGMAWADAGYGLTIFERYPTDRIRGEFPNKRNKLLPLEQFFPFPDGIIYLDIFPEDSTYRKKEDNHSIKEMRSKRKNYLNLIKEFDEVYKISPYKDLSSKVVNAKNYIFKISQKKQNLIFRTGKVKRVYWKKNFKRVISGKNLNKSQKDAFFEQNI